MTCTKVYKDRVHGSGCYPQGQRMREWPWWPQSSITEQGLSRHAAGQAFGRIAVALASYFHFSRHALRDGHPPQG